MPRRPSQQQSMAPANLPAAGGRLMPPPFLTGQTSGDLTGTPPPRLSPTPGSCFRRDRPPVCFHSSGSTFNSSREADCRAEAPTANEVAGPTSPCSVSPRAGIPAGSPSTRPNKPHHAAFRFTFPVAALSLTFALFSLSPARLPAVRRRVSNH